MEAEAKAAARVSELEGYTNPLDRVFVLRVNRLKTYYFTSRGPVKAVDDVTVWLKRGESLGIAGESGCGKTTFASSIIKMISPPGRIVSGEIYVDGTEVSKLDEPTMRKKVRWKKVSMIFQGAMNALTPVYRVGYQMAEPLIYHKGMEMEEAMEIVKKYLEMVGLSPAVAERYPHELSGGMKQRVIIAMALLLEPPLVIADEPTTALDVVVQAQIMNLLKRIKKESGKAFIFITHDLSILSEVSDNIMVMYGGHQVEWGTGEDIYLDPKHPYTQKLIQAIPRVHRDVDRLEYIPGTPPNLLNPPKGCRFHPRCPFATDKCKTEEPPTFYLGGRHFVKCWLYEREGERVEDMPKFIQEVYE